MPPIEILNDKAFGLNVNGPQLTKFAYQATMKQGILKGEVSLYH
jgi:hypothetical protein